MEAAAYGLELDETKASLEATEEQDSPSPETPGEPSGPLREPMTRADVEQAESELPPEALRILKDAYRGEWRDVLRG